MIVGGWEYVVASYAVVWAGILIYSGSLLWRHWQAKREEQP